MSPLFITSKAQAAGAFTHMDLWRSTHFCGDPPMAIATQGHPNFTNMSATRKQCVLQGPGPANEAACFHALQGLLTGTEHREKTMPPAFYTEVCCPACFRSDVALTLIYINFLGWGLFHHTILFQVLLKPTYITSSTPSLLFYSEDFIFYLSPLRDSHSTRRLNKPHPALNRTSEFYPSTISCLVPVRDWEIFPWQFKANILVQNTCLTEQTFHLLILFTACFGSIDISGSCYFRYNLPPSSLCSLLFLKFSDGHLIQNLCFPAPTKSLKLFQVPITRFLKTLKKHGIPFRFKCSGMLPIRLFRSMQWSELCR